MSVILFRSLAPVDAPAFRQARLRALKEFPDNYTSTHAEESAAPLAYHEAMLAHGNGFGALDGDLLIGTTLICGFESERQRHKCSLSAVFMLPEYQGRGLGKRLILATLEKAAERYEQVIIAVDTENRGAIGLYESVGFERLGIEKRALKEGDRYLDDLWMTRFL